MLRALLEMLSQRWGYSKCRNLSRRNPTKASQKKLPDYVKGLDFESLIGISRVHKNSQNSWILKLSTFYRSFHLSSVLEHQMGKPTISASKPLSQLRPATVFTIGARLCQALRLEHTRPTFVVCWMHKEDRDSLPLVKSVSLLSFHLKVNLQTDVCSQPLPHTGDLNWLKSFGVRGSQNANPEQNDFDQFIRHHTRSPRTRRSPVAKSLFHSTWNRIYRITPLLDTPQRRRFLCFECGQSWLWHCQLGSANLLMLHC